MKKQDERKRKLFIVFSYVLAIIIIFLSLFILLFPLNLQGNTLAGKTISTTPKSVPLIIKDMTSASRSISLNDGKTEYFSVGSSNNLVYLINFDNSYKYNYEGKSYSGALMVYHTFGAKASKPFNVSISYLSTLNVAKQILVYFPAFDTSSSGKKMYFYVDAEGLTYYADAENDGLVDESTELLGVNDALIEVHLAARSSLATPATTTPPATTTCIDSDKNANYLDGKNILTKGTTDARAVGGILFEDRCISDESGRTIVVDACSGVKCKLQEGYCSDIGINVANYSCEFGCASGKCLSSSADSEAEVELSEEEIAEGYEVNVVGDNSYFVPYDGVYYFLKVESVDNIRKEVKVFSDSLEDLVLFRVGETKTLDLDLDGEDDVSLKLLSVIDEKSAKIHFALLEKDNIGEEEQGNVAEETGVDLGADNSWAGDNEQGADSESDTGDSENLVETSSLDKDGSKLVDSKSQESKGFWSSMSDNTKMVVLISALFIAMTTVLIIAYIVTSRD